MFHSSKKIAITALIITALASYSQSQAMQMPEVAPSWYGKSANALLSLVQNKNGKISISKVAIGVGAAAALYYGWQKLGESSSLTVQNPLIFNRDAAGIDSVLVNIVAPGTCTFKETARNDIKITATRMGTIQECDNVHSLIGNGNNQLRVDTLRNNNAHLGGFIDYEIEVPAGKNITVLEIVKNHRQSKL